MERRKREVATGRGKGKTIVKGKEYEDVYHLHK